MPLESEVEETLERVGININQILGEYMGEFNSNRPMRFQHIVRTILQGIISCEYLQRHDKILEGRRLLETYITLLREFKNFREEELKAVDNSSIPGSVKEYINRMVIKLREDSPSNNY